MALWVKTLVSQWCKPDPLCDLSLSLSLCVCVSLCLFLHVYVSLSLCVSLLSVSHSRRKTKKDTESLRAVHSIKTIKMNSGSAFCVLSSSMETFCGIFDHTV